MKIKYIAIRNFRGIKELNWKVNGDFICFIGPGDSTKSTILDAIEYALSPRWNIPFEDTDFYNLDVQQCIKIDITIGQLPDELLSEYKCGLCLRGWNSETGLHDEPGENEEPVLTISLQVAKDLEPKWLVINDRIQDEKRISPRDRSYLGTSRLGVYTSRHFSWSTGSALSAMTGEEIKLDEILAETARKIRNDVDLNSLKDVAEVVSKVERLGKSVGVVPKDGIRAHLDIKRLAIKDSGLVLHDGNVPLRLSGSGTQRLMGLALQLGLIEKGGINLIDEIEYGLEPHRISQVLHLLRNSFCEKGQIFLTTHSPCVLEEVDILNLRIVYSENGVTTIKEFYDDPDRSFQKLIRKSPFAFLAKRIIVCEGKTEEGVLRGVDNVWQQNKMRGIWSYGVVSVHGGGDASFDVAKRFQSLKYPVLWWGDSDVPSSNTKKEELRNLGIPIVEWSDESNLEKRLFLDLPWDGVKNLVDVAIDLYEKQEIVGQVKYFYGDISDDINGWVDSVDLRNALGKAAHKKEWFKCISYGERVGNIVGKNLGNIDNVDLGIKIKSIRGWVETGEYR